MSAERLTGELMNAYRDKRKPSQAQPPEPGSVICLKPVILDLEPVSISEVRRSIQALNDGLALHYREPTDDSEAEASEDDPPKDAS